MSASENGIGRSTPGPSGKNSTPYRAPTEDLALALEVAGLDELLRLDYFQHIDQESILLALEEFGRLASRQIARSDRVGDIHGACLDTTSFSVRTPEDFHDAYRLYVEGGWGSLAFPQEFGGGDLPSAVALATQEMFASANMALSLNPVLTQGAIETLLQWGTPEQKSTYLPRLLTGEWTGTMNLTEPDAGSDLGEIRTLAETDSDGRWRLSGTKIFITWGEHDLADNIVHLVLARTPGAPVGTKGLSLFLVPKFLDVRDGTPPIRNSVRCVGLEEKLGIHGSPTCVMSFEEALGELIGPLHGGIRAMFTMMNAARLSIGVQGPAVGERAFQHAVGYAAERLQGRSSGVVAPNQSAIIEHPDVRRMLLTMSTTTQAARLLLFWVSIQVDKARHGVDETDRASAQAMADLVTPVAKAWSTDTGFAVASLGVQVLGGAGYIEESGMAQRLRDARIGSIYEGTNGIQALDLVSRKLEREGGAWVRQLLREIAMCIPEVVMANDPLENAINSLSSALATLVSTTEWMLDRLATSRDDALAGATSYLELFGITVGGWLMLRRAQLAVATSHASASRIVGESNFFALEILGRSDGLAKPITAGIGHLRVTIGAS